MDYSDKRIALFLVRHGTWKLRAALALVALGILAVDPVVAALRHLADKALDLVQSGCSRLADSVSVEVKELAARYKVAE